MAEQKLMFPSSFQLGLKNLLVYVPRNNKKRMWKMDQKIMVHKEE